MAEQKIAIITDSSADLTPEELDQFGFFCLELKVIMPDNTILPTGLTPENLELFWDKLSKTEQLPSTSMASKADFEAMLEHVADLGYTHAIVLPISSAISGTVDAAFQAAENAPIEACVIDSRLATTPLSLLMFKIHDMQEQGMDYDQLCTAIPKVIDEINLWLPIDTVKNLVKGGRTTHMAGIASALLDIKPILGFNKEGHLVSFTKARTTARARKKVVEHFVERCQQKGTLEGFFFHTRNEEGCDDLRRMFDDAGIDYVELGEPREIGPVVATHLGAGAAGWACVPTEIPGL